MSTIHDRPHWKTAYGNASEKRAWSQTPHRNWHVDLGNLSWKLGFFNAMSCFNIFWIMNARMNIMNSKAILKLAAPQLNLHLCLHLVGCLGNRDIDKEDSRLMNGCYCLGRSSWGVSVNEIFHFITGDQEVIIHWSNYTSETNPTAEWLCVWNHLLSKTTPTFPSKPRKTPWKR